jgi:hypothetical protein
MRSMCLYTRQEMNTGSIGRSMNREIAALRNVDQLPAANNTSTSDFIQPLEIANFAAPKS